MGCNESSLKSTSKFRHKFSRARGSSSSKTPVRTSATIAVVGSCKRPVQGFSDENNKDCKNGFDMNIICAEQECRLIGLEDDSEGQEDEGFLNDERKGIFSISEVKQSKQNQNEGDTDDVLIPVYLFLEGL